MLNGYRGRESLKLMLPACCCWC